MHQLRSLAPIQMTKDRLGKYVSEWCGMHGLREYRHCLCTAIHQFKKMEVFYNPPAPAIGSDHRKHHICFARVPRTNFDANGKVSLLSTECVFLFFIHAPELERICIRTQES